jgi:phage shock protein PspC (stress-responsive transcriptional regulator)
MELTTPSHATDARPLRRSPHARLVAGVASGLADYLDIDVAMVRVVLVALAIMGGIGVPLYVAAWLLIPEEGSEETVADELLEHLHRR